MLASLRDHIRAAQWHSTSVSGLPFESLAKVTQCNQVQVKSDKVQVVLLDADGSVSGPASRELALAAPDVKAIVRVEGGAQRWQEGDLPWKEAGSGLVFPTINLDVFKTLSVASGASDGDIVVAQGAAKCAASDGTEGACFRPTCGREDLVTLERS